MKITTTQLKKIIAEEISKLNEVEMLPPGLDLHKLTTAQLIVLKNAVIDELNARKLTG